MLEILERGRDSKQDQIPVYCSDAQVNILVFLPNLLTKKHCNGFLADLKGGMDKPAPPPPPTSDKNTSRSKSTPRVPKSKEKTLERFSKPNIRFGSGRSGSKIVSKFRLTQNRKLRSANRNTIDHTIECPALLLWCLAVENRGPCVPKKCSLSNCASPGDFFCQVLDHWWSHGQHLLPIHSLMMAMYAYLPKISCRSKKNSSSALSWMEASCQTSDKSSEVWGMVWTWRSYERKTVEYLTKERPDFSRQVLRSAGGQTGQTESKIRFGSGPGRPKLSDGSAAFFDSIFDLEPGHRPKPSNRTEIRFAKPLYCRSGWSTPQNNQKSKKRNNEESTFKLSMKVCKTVPRPWVGLNHQPFG